MRTTLSVVWTRFVRDGWTVQGAARTMGVSEEYARLEMARVRRRVQAAAVAEKVGFSLRTNWSPTAARHLQ